VQKCLITDHSSPKVYSSARKTRRPPPARMQSRTIAHSTRTCVPHPPLSAPDSSREMWRTDKVPRPTPGESHTSSTDHDTIPYSSVVISKRLAPSSISQDALSRPLCTNAWTRSAPAGQGPPQERACLFVVCVHAAVPLLTESSGSSINGPEANAAEASRRARTLRGPLSSPCAPLKSTRALPARSSGWP